MEIQSVLVILVPEAELLVGPFRSKYDSSAADGMPAHITINYPFLSIENDGPGTIGKLKQLFSSHPAFEFSLGAAGRFPGVIYLEPSPARPFTDLIQAVADRFPESPPYGGMFKDVVPHLTIATAEDDETIESVNREFASACAGRLPIRAVAREVLLMDNKPGLWTRRVSFALARGL